MYREERQVRKEIKICFPASFPEGTSPNVIARRHSRPLRRDNLHLYKGIARLTYNKHCVARIKSNDLYESVLKTEVGDYTQSSKWVCIGHPIRRMIEGTMENDRRQHIVII
jgi:hypothetical protein